MLIGDNLSSHFDQRVLQLTEENNISFLCLPSNATHLLQPLDVAFFGPLKREWRKVLESWKTTQRARTVTKDAFPGLLKQLLGAVCDSNTSKNLEAGFRATGLYPVNPSVVLNKLPDGVLDQSSSTEQIETDVYNDVLDVLQSLRGTSEPATKMRKTRVNVTPGKSISSEDISGEPSAVPSPTTSVIQTTISGKGKGKGKKSTSAKTKSGSMATQPTPDTETMLHVASSSSNTASTSASAVSALLTQPEGDKDCQCIVCDEPYVDPPVEDWIQCMKCQLWCHEACAEIPLSKDTYICDFCM